MGKGILTRKALHKKKGDEWIKNAWICYKGDDAKKKDDNNKYRLDIEEIKNIGKIQGDINTEEGAEVEFPVVYVPLDPNHLNKSHCVYNIKKIRTREDKNYYFYVEKIDGIFNLTSNNASDTLYKEFSRYIVKGGVKEEKDYIYEYQLSKRQLSITLLLEYLSNNLKVMTKKDNSNENSEFIASDFKTSEWMSNRVLPENDYNEFKKNVIFGGEETHNIIRNILLDTTFKESEINFLINGIKKHIIEDILNSYKEKEDKEDKKRQYYPTFKYYGEEKGANSKIDDYRYLWFVEGGTKEDYTVEEKDKEGKTEMFEEIIKVDCQDKTLKDIVSEISKKKVQISEKDRFASEEEELNFLKSIWSISDRVFARIIVIKNLYYCPNLCGFLAKYAQYFEYVCRVINNDKLKNKNVSAPLPSGDSIDLLNNLYLICSMGNDDSDDYEDWDDYELNRIFTKVSSPSGGEGFFDHRKYITIPEIELKYDED